MIKTKPFLKWAGSKYRCIDSILSSFPPGDRLVEPFTGSAAVFINSNYPRYLLGEQNKDLINLYEYLKKEGEIFINYCQQFFCVKNNAEDVFYQLRKEFNQCKRQRRRAALFLYLNRHGYNGLCRYNQQGIYNVPFGRYSKPYFPAKEMFYFYQKCQQVTFLNHDFRHTFSLAQTGDIIYCDPPYVPLTSSANFSSYTNKKFTQQDQIDLAQLAQETAEKGITVIISNHDTLLTREFYQGSDILSFPVNRYISCNALNRKPVQELIAIFR